MSDDDLGTSTAVSFDNCLDVAGPFFHGTRVVLPVGTELVPGRTSNFQAERVMRHIYFATLVDTAAWGAELATALAGDEHRGHVYEVAPTGPFEDDPNVTDRKFPGNPTRSYRSRHPLRITREVHGWPGHDVETLDRMLASLALLREQGRDLIDD